MSTACFRVKRLDSGEVCLFDNFWSAYIYARYVAAKHIPVEIY